MRTIRTQKRRAAFLASLSEGFSVGGSAIKAGMSRRAAYEWREADEAFARDWDAAVEEGTELLEDEARRRAFEGTEKPVFQNGQLVGHIQEYSDTLLIFQLKARRPEKYRDNHKVDLTGDITHRLDGAKDALQRKLAKLIAPEGEGGVSSGSD